MEDYKYIIGFMLSLYARTYCTKEDILNINAELIQESENNFIDLLKKNNIDVKQKNFTEKCLNVCQKYLEEMRSLKSEMSDKNENRRF